MFKEFMEKYIWSSRPRVQESRPLVVHGQPAEGTQTVVIHYNPNHPCEFPRDLRTGVKMTPEAIREERRQHMSMRRAQEVVRGYRHQRRADVVEFRR